MAKRLLDALTAGIALLVLWPLLLVIAVAVRATSAGPALFRQTRVGLRGRPFEILKFRTMTLAGGPLITVAGDKRITAVGGFLRKSKLDELPQLINVLKGDMSLVGPRPEVPRYVEHYPPEVREIVLSVRPGITDEASILFSRENELLAAAADPERMYVQEILPQKLALYVHYVRRRSARGDLQILLRTLRKVLRG